jgi:hypothetical protein
MRSRALVFAGRVVPQVDGRTNENGVAGFAFASALRAFTVLMSRGRAEGKPVRGTFRVEVAEYEPDTIVYVNPATTLLAELRDCDQGLSERDATRTNNRVYASGPAVWNGPAASHGQVNVGEIQGIGMLDGRKAVFDLDGCAATLALEDKGLEVEDESGCGGLNVTFKGTYRRK